MRSGEINKNQLLGALARIAQEHPQQRDASEHRPETEQRQPSESWPEHQAQQQEPQQPPPAARHEEGGQHDGGEDQDEYDEEGMPIPQADIPFSGPLRQSNRRRLGVELAEQEMAECTFRPQVRPLPPQYGSRRALESMPFAERMEQWKRHKATEYERRRQEEARREVEGCTFQPTINRRSARVASASRRGAPHERLHARTPSRASSAPRANRPQSARAAGRRSEHLLAQEERDLAQCTFQPKVNRPRGATPVRSRYLDASSAGRASSASRGRRGRGEQQLPTGMQECTFTPRINAVPASMRAAKQYVSRSVVDRLTATARARQAERQRREEEAKQEEASVGGSSQRGATGHRRRSSSASRGSQRETPRRVGAGAFLRNVAGDGGAGSEVGADEDELQEEEAAEAAEARRREAEEKKRRFQEFMARQNHASARKKQFVEHERRQQQSSRQPKLCDRSRKLVERKAPGGFLERMARGAMRKEHEALRERAKAARDPECTFKPKINPMSKRMQPRSVVEMSRGDALRRETAVRLMRLKKQQEEMEEHPFQPQLNRNDDVDGRLRLNEDADNYVERVQRDRALWSDRARRLVMEAEMKEFKECTFQPEVHEAPEYVRRIARSMALTRAARPPEPGADKPDWR